MEIIECNGHVKCELGACRKRATRAVEFDHIGIRGRLYMCDECMNELYAAMGRTLIPKSVETAKKKTKEKK